MLGQLFMQPLRRPLMPLMQELILEQLLLVLMEIQLKPPLVFLIVQELVQRLIHLF